MLSDKNVVWDIFWQSLLLFSELLKFLLYLNLVVHYVFDNDVDNVKLLLQLRNETRLTDMYLLVFHLWKLTNDAAGYLNWLDNAFPIVKIFKGADQEEHPNMFGAWLFQYLKQRVKG
jgi:hypothetical protein